MNSPDRLNALTFDTPGEIRRTVDAEIVVTKFMSSYCTALTLQRGRRVIAWSASSIILIEIQ